VRVAFSQKQSEGNGFILRQRAVVPSNSTGNPHNYPLSIAAWALLEGRIIAWPEERDRPVDFAWLDRLRKTARIAERLNSSDTDELPEVKKYLDVSTVRHKFANRRLSLGDFYQDWASDQPRSPYTQFLSVPVPLLEHAPNREDPPEYGVFNIDSSDELPLLDQRVRELLKLASSVTVLAFKRFDETGADLQLDRVDSANYEPRQRLFVRLRNFVRS
jgi:hypothetical protein